MAEHNDNNLILESESVNKNFYQTFRPRFGSLGSVGIPSISFQSLSGQQKDICNVLLKQISRPVKEQLEDPLRMVLVGQAGTGKSLTVMHLQNLMDIQRQENPAFNYKAASFTGLSAHHIHAQTIHSCFKIPVFRPEEEWPKFLEKAVDSRAKLEMSAVVVLILDEFQMIPRSMFHYIDQFMRKCDPSRSRIPFAGRSVILAGDIYQLQPIGDSSIFFPRFDGKASLQDMEMTRIYRKYFKTVFVLEKSFRQDSASEYYEFLCRLKKGKCTKDDVDKLRTRLKKNLSQEEQETFADALHVFPLKQLVYLHNKRELERRFGPEEIMEIDEGRAKITIAKGAKVMITRNLTVSGGIFNGSVGEVVDVVYNKPKEDEEEEEENEKPEIKCLNVRVQGYDGTVFLRTPGGTGVPMFRMMESELAHTGSKKYENFKRFPVQLFYGSTAHKSIGLSLPKICVFLDTTEMCPALSFVTLSRVRDYGDLCILDEDISYDRIMSLDTRAQNFLLIVNHEEKRLKNLEQEMIQGKLQEFIEEHRKNL